MGKSSINGGFSIIMFDYLPEGKFEKHDLSRHPK